MVLRLALALCLGASAAVADVSVTIHYLRQEVEQPPVLSNLDPIPEDLGLKGAELGLADNATTGRFMGQTWTLEVTEVPIGGDLAAAARAALATTDLIVLDAPADAALALADLPEAAGALIFNSAAPDDRLRGADCRANLLHTLPSNAMRTDALAQFLLNRRWDDLALITGTHPDDNAFATSLRASLTKFGMRLTSEKTWAFDADMRRNASQEVPLFTQDLKAHDVLLIADEIHDFGRYIAYNTWIPRPVAGSEGLVPVAWAQVVEQWGAAQLQSRFTDLAARPMQSRDYAAWAAVRAMGEAVTRTGAADTATLRAYLLGPDFELAGFKGRPLSFRDWNGQLRQPIPLVTQRAVVAQAPLEGFLHQVNELDTLGRDAPESDCTAFGN
ncbi:ABC transporter, substrate binding protein, PQQ-dependent alcohol dehydrogenase system [Mameliella alba]|uniref:ABC transporter substrate-binding protein n=1 Tax=Mameliella alba TaxID=561184 RepID=UPI0008883DD0|nr:ABC transporter substrate-binding protein [Mameliella alba]OWV48000.1 branched-chain amino acid ABC transporter substrate-binding protein [Mameliella alba]PTR39592.1 ABC transporter substrate binding protein (PQQ-dependent alcohol dehydrogenase system) [Mameliella alba]GGF63162.1 branched-chain amino acid ABC transporter substrate-binding protein [Mameliella alba]SDD18729.1 ABC transporter, substrate binding protein, PQQ-dependent alcohol dehydrogenase system [Mameliella alba]